MQATCQAALEVVGNFVGLETGCKIVFAKMRPLMLLPGSNDLNQALVNECRCLEIGGGTIEEMNAEFIAAETQARRDGSYRKYPKKALGAWSPPAWRAPSWGIDSDACEDHNATVDTLRDKILQDWRSEHNGVELGIPHLKMYMTYMVAHSIKNHIDQPGDDERVYFDGEP